MLNTRCTIVYQVYKYLIGLFYLIVEVLEAYFFFLALIVFGLLMKSGSCLVPFASALQISTWQEWSSVQPFPELRPACR